MCGARQSAMRPSFVAGGPAACAGGTVAYRNTSLPPMAVVTRPGAAACTAVTDAPALPLASQPPQLPQTLPYLSHADPAPPARTQACSLEEHSPILVWHPGRRRFEPTAHLSGISCATGLAAGRLRQHGAAGPPTTYLLATGDRTANGSYTGAMTHVWSLEEEKAPGAFGGGGGGGGGGGVGGHFTSTLQH